MKFIIKLFPEITIKSQSVRLRFIKILTGNIRNVLKHYDETLAVVRHWDNIEVRAKDENQRIARRWFSSKFAQKMKTSVWLFATL